MVKKYVDGETKEQRKVRKALEKLAKQDQELGLLDVPEVENISDEKRYILCLKHGNKYPSYYVNKLYNMCKRHCNLKFEFVCLTDDPKDIDRHIKIIKLPPYLQGWWCKPYMFAKDLGLDGSILYFDLDVVLSGNIDILFNYKPNNWCTIRDFTRAQRPNWQKYNSSIIRFEAGKLDFIWKYYLDNMESVKKKYYGDQDYLYDIAETNRPELFPDHWIRSWKWEIRKDKRLAPGPRGKRKLQKVENVVPPLDCCVCVFHGDPNPEFCEDPWVIENWK